MGGEDGCEELLGPSPGLICEMLIHLVREIIYLSGKSQGILIQAVPFL